MEALNMSRVWHEPARLMLCLCLLLCPVSAWALEVPTLTGRVVDLAHVLPPNIVESLTARLKAHEETTSNQVTVLVLPSLEEEPLESFSHRVSTTWKLGQKGTDNGVLLLVAMKERKIRIEVGYGLEGALPDATAFDITERRIKPHFRNNDYQGGLAEGIDSIFKAVRGEYQGTGGTVREKSGRDRTSSFFGNLILFGFFFLISWLLSRVKRRRGYHYSSSGAGWGWAIGSGSGGGWSSGSSGGGGFSGFSGGGGSFGGGGAGSSW